MPETSSNRSSSELFQTLRNPLESFKANRAKKSREEDERSRASRRYRALVQAGGTFVFHLNPDGSTQNPEQLERWQTITGQTRESAGRGGWAAIVHPDDREMAIKEWREALEKEPAPFQFKMRLRHANGEFRYQAIRVAPVLDDDGQLLEWVGTMDDVHDEIEAQDQLDENEARLQNLADATGLALWTLEPDTDRIIYKLHFEAFFGSTREINTLSEFEELVHPSDVSIVQRTIRRAASQQGDGVFEFRVRAPECLEPNPDNPAHWNWSTCKMVARSERDKDGREKTVLFGINMDISERKRAEAAKIAADLRYRVLIDLSPQVVFMARPDGMLSYINSQAAQFMGMSDEEALGEAWLEAIHPDDRESVMSKWIESVSTGTPYETEMRFYRVIDHSYRWHVTRARPVRDANGDIDAWIGVAIDVHEIKQAQHQAEAARRQTEDISRARDEFMAVVSHELRTPLSAIMGWAGLLRSGNLDEDSVAQAIEIIERNAQAQAKIVEDVLDVARVSTGNLRIENHLIDFAWVVREALEGAQSGAKSKNITIETSVNTPAIIEGDAGRLRQVVGNLLSNAIKFTPEGGNVRVQLVRLNEGSHRPCIQLRVEDSGQGIQAELLAHVFERFWQADSSSTRRHGGLGLGLALVRQLIEAHGGEVGVQSEGANQGATFWVTLPLAHIESPAPRLLGSDFDLLDGADMSETPGPLQGLNFLWVEDSPDTRDLVSLLLKLEGANVRSVEDVPTARAWLETQPFDAVISDLGLPGENGYALLEWIRRREIGTPTIALSAYVDQREQALRCGFDAFIGKPLVIGELLEIVRTICTRA